LPYFRHYYAIISLAIAFHIFIIDAFDILLLLRSPPDTAGWLPDTLPPITLYA
jgi:hypothetical protein